MQIWNSMVPKRAEYGTLVDLFKNIISKYPGNSMLENVYEDFEKLPVKTRQTIIEMIHKLALDADS